MFDKLPGKKWNAAIDQTTHYGLQSQSDEANQDTDETLDYVVQNRPGAGAATLPREFGPYELIEELARGGMGVVFRARQINLNRFVALKMILAGELANDEQVQRFYSEAEAAAGLDHPGIVPIFEVGEYDGQHFFSMGLVEGTSLASQIRDGLFTPLAAASLLKQMAEAVAYAHYHGVIHRDLKPANVLLQSFSGSSASGSARSLSKEPVIPVPQFQSKITDFGLAKRISGDSGLTASGQVMGTPSYMPPEQAQGKMNEVGTGADIYALGAILYEMLTGRAPFRGATWLETLQQVTENEPIEPRKLNPTLDRDLETICLKCLSKQVSDRYVDADAFVAELDRYLSGMPIEARRLSPLVRSWHWCKPRPLQTGIMAASLCAVVLLGAFVSARKHSQRVEQISALVSESNRSAHWSASLKQTCALPNQPRNSSRKRRRPSARFVCLIPEKGARQNKNSPASL